MLFKPGLAGSDIDGVHDTTFATVMKVDVDIRKDLYANIVCSGGSTMFPSFPDRLAKVRATPWPPRPPPPWVRPRSPA